MLHNSENVAQTKIFIKKKNLALNYFNVTACEFWNTIYIYICMHIHTHV